LSSDAASACQVDANALKVFGVGACAEITAFDAKAIIWGIAESTEADGAGVGASSRCIASAARGIIDRGRFAKPVGHVARVKSGTNEFGGAAFFSAAARFADLVLCTLKAFTRDGWIATPVGTEETVGARPPRTARIAFFDASELFFTCFIALFAGATAPTRWITRKRADFFTLPRDAQQIAFTGIGLTRFTGLFAAISREANPFVGLHLTASGGCGALGLKRQAFEAAEAFCGPSVFVANHRLWARFGLWITGLAFFGSVVFGAALCQAKRLGGVFAVFVAYASIGDKAVSLEALGL
jgi:hypothetical protein